MTRQTWLAAHPYLQPLESLDALVHAAMSEIDVPSAGLPVWNDYLADFHDGIPLLRSPSVAIDFEPAVGAVVALVEKAASMPLPGAFSDESRVLNDELDRDRDAPRRVVEWLIDEDSFATSHPGLLRYLGWTVLAGYLSPVVPAFGAWRQEDRWLRNFCPTCGAPPAMGHLSGTDPGRLRLLTCGRCATAWRYRRTGCPFCENADDHRLSVMALEGEGGLRIDYCQACSGYLKTYNGNGDEDVLLADWTSLHLDIAARDRGLKRLAASLYEL